MDDFLNNDESSALKNEGLGSFVDKLLIKVILIVLSLIIRTEKAVPTFFSCCDICR